MKIYDPLYGCYELSSISNELCVLPEVRRLSQIRLLNSISPSLATLSELRRYAHTLGVLHLFNLWKKGAGRRYSREEHDALEVAIILHDVATPPFGHLFEYILRDEKGWDHEAEAVTTLLKDYSPASTAQPIYMGRTPKVLDRIERRGVSLELVKDILTKRHQLSGLIMGVLDFDNIDNVWRMAWALGMPIQRGHGALLAENLDVDSDGTLIIAKPVEELLEVWAGFRRSVYEVLIFDQPTVASQTILTHCIRAGIAKGIVSNNDWFLTDESLLEKLSTDPELKDLISQQYLGLLPEPVLTIQIPWRNLPFYELDRGQIEAQVLTALERAGKNTWWVYVFKEKGSFEKQVKYSLQDGGSRVSGETSRSLIVSIFSDKIISASQKKFAVSVVVENFRHQGVDVNEYLRIIESGGKSLAENRGLIF